MITCPRCRVEKPTVGELAAHLFHEHVMTERRAWDEAQRAAAACPGCGRASGAHNKTCAYRTASAGAPAPVTPPPAPEPLRANDLTPPSLIPKERSMPKSEKPCRVCARLTKKAGVPTKCKRHGGGTGAKKPKPATGRPVRRGGGLDAKAAAMLTAAKTRVTQLRADLAAEERRVEVLQELVGA